LYNGENPVSPVEYLNWKSHSTTFEQMSAADYWTPNLTGNDRPEQLNGVRVTDNFFQMLGAKAIVGRTFTESEAQSDGAPVVVLGDKIWKQRFGSDPGVVGRVLTLDGRDYRVIGVMPPDFEFPLFWATRAELWAPLPLGGRVNDDGHSLRLFGRLKRNAT